MELLWKRLFGGGFDLLAWQEQGFFELLAKVGETWFPDKRWFSWPLSAVPAALAEVSGCCSLSVTLGSCSSPL